MGAYAVQPMQPLTNQGLRDLTDASKCQDVIYFVTQQGPYAVILTLVVIIIL